MASPVECSVQHCGSKYGFTVDDICTVSSSRIYKHFVENIDPSVVDNARAVSYTHLTLPTNREV